MTHDPTIRPMASRIRHLGAAQSATREVWLMRLTNVALLIGARDRMSARNRCGSFPIGSGEVMGGQTR